MSGPRVAFLCRGYPGLGKVMGAVALEALLREATPSLEALFLSYERGVAYLRQAGANVVDLFDGLPPLTPNAFCTPFGPETTRAMNALVAFAPTLVVNDGKPYLVELTSELLGVPTVVLAHPLDLHNPGNAPLAVSLFRHFYARAHCVIAHGIERLPPGTTTLGGRAGRVLEVNTLVRPSVLRARGHAGERLALTAVLGGGSRNTSDHFRAGTLQLGTWVLRACAALGLSSAKLFVADPSLAAELPAPAPGVTIVADAADVALDLAAADVVVGRAGRNLVSEFVALKKRGVVVPIGGTAFRTSGQEAAAEEAVRANPNLRLARLADGYDAFEQTLREAQAQATKPVRWEPGNEAAASVLRRLLRGDAPQTALTEGLDDAALGEPLP